MKPEVLLVARLMPRVMESLERDYRLHRLWEASDQEAFLRDIGGRVRAIATTGHHGASAELQRRLPNLEIVACFGVGYDAVDVGEAARRGIVVTNTPDVLTDDVADLALALLVSVFRRLPQADRFVREGRWPEGSFPLCRKLGGKTLGIVGLGRIGKALARRALAAEMQVVYHGRHPQPEQPYRFYPDLVAMAREVEALALVLPGGAETRAIVGRPVLEALGPKGVLINVARGSVVDEAALVELLVAGKLGGAGLDVFADEPNVPQALLGLDNVVLQPHQGSATEETRWAMGDLMLSNLAAHFAGQRPPTPVPETPLPVSPAQALAPKP